jgi:predicted nucleic acid-binding protein
LILDTNALSAAADDEQGILKILAASNSLELPVIVLGEYRFGILRSRNRAQYIRWLESLIADVGVLEISEGTTHHYADINLELRAAGTPIPTNDLWLAALCRQHQLSILSRDRHFDAVKGLHRIGW